MGFTQKTSRRHNKKDRKRQKWGRSINPISEIFTNMWKRSSQHGLTDVSNALPPVAAAASLDSRARRFAGGNLFQHSLAPRHTNLLARAHSGRILIKHQSLRRPRPGHSQLNVLTS